MNKPEDIFNSIINLKPVTPEMLSEGLLSWIYLDRDIHNKVLKGKNIVCCEFHDEDNLPGGVLLFELKGHLGELLHIWLKRSLRGKELAAPFFDKSLSMLREKGIRSITVSCGEYDGLQNYFRSLGFKYKLSRYYYESFIEELSRSELMTSTSLEAFVKNIRPKNKDLYCYVKKGRECASIKIQKEGEKLLVISEIKMSEQEEGSMIMVLALLRMAIDEFKKSNPDETGFHVGFLTEDKNIYSGLNRVIAFPYINEKIFVYSI